MKCVILAGGLGTRLGRETQIRPKPMVEIGSHPILWHIMKMYGQHGITEFVICLGYKGYVIKEYFANYFLHESDVTFDVASGEMVVHESHAEPWKVTLVDTGPSTLTGGRLKRVREYIGDDEFCFTYGDGVSDVDITKLLEFHRQHGKLATVTAVTPPGRFGALNITADMVKSFQEKPEQGGYINGGFFVLSPKVIDLVTDDTTTWEREPMEQLAREGQLAAFHHDGFWQPMDTEREKNLLEGLWASGNAPWKTW